MRGLPERRPDNIRLDSVMRNIRKNKMVYLAPANSQKGYTLIELAMVIIIVSLLMTSGIAYYQVWLEKQMHERTINNLEDMALNVSAYRGQLGSYPCPAPIDVDRDDPDYGRMDCSGVIEVSSLRADISRNVLIGMVPFRDLNITAEFAHDAHGQRILYAVTKEQAILGDPYVPGNGGISVNDEFGNSRIEPEHSADFIILSHGKDRAGSYNSGGNIFDPCANASDLDEENCDQDSTFVIAMHSESGNQATHSDDIGFYQMPLNVPLWARNPTNPDDIYSIRQLGASGDAGGDWRYNYFAAQDPQSIEDARFWVGGNARVDGQVRANKYCFYNDQYCFETKMIAGDQDSADPDEGLDCADTLENGFMWGIKNAEIQCKGDTFEVKCPGREYLGGLSYGDPRCVALPCRAQTISSECGSDTHDLRDPDDPSAVYIDHGTQTEVFYGGDSGCYRTQYQCDSGRWIKILDEGYEFCSCTTLATHVDNFQACPAPYSSQVFGMAWDRTVECNDAGQGCIKHDWVDSYEYCPGSGPGSFPPISPPGDPTCPPSGCLTQNPLQPPGGGGSSSIGPPSGPGNLSGGGSGPGPMPCDGTGARGRPCGN